MSPPGVGVGDYPKHMASAEQQARDLLERMEVAGAQNFSAGELVELANLIADANKYRRMQGQMVPVPLTNPSCQHRHIDNETWQCRACGERMVTQSVEAETVLSAPNAAAGLCSIPNCDGESGHGCTAVYVPDVRNQRTIVIGYRTNYACERCGNSGTLISAGEPISWECGQWHEGDYVATKDRPARMA